MFANIWRLLAFSKLSVNTDKVKHLWVDLRDMDTLNKENLNEVRTKCFVCTRLAGRCRERLCIWWDWGSLPLYWQTTGSSGRSSCPGERSWCLQKCPAGHMIASGEFAGTEIHTKTRLKWQNSDPINRMKTVTILMAIINTERHWGWIWLHYMYIIGHSKWTSQINLRIQARHASEKLERSVNLPTSTCLHTDDEMRCSRWCWAKTPALLWVGHSLTPERPERPERHTTACLLALHHQDCVYLMGGSL